MILMTLGARIRNIYLSSGANRDCEPVNNDELDNRLLSFLFLKKQKKP